MDLHPVAVATFFKPARGASSRMAFPEQPPTSVDFTMLLDVPGTLLRPPRSCRGRTPAPKAEELLQGSWVAELRSVWQPWRLETNY